MGKASYLNHKIEGAVRPRGAPAREVPTVVGGARSQFSRGSNPTKLARLRARAKWMQEVGSWTYYPEEDLFEEVVSVMHPSVRFALDGIRKPKFIPCLQIYGREVYEASEVLWRKFLMGHPEGVARLSAEFHEPPGGGGLIDIDAFAVRGNDVVRDRYTGQ